MVRLCIRAGKAHFLWFQPQELHWMKHMGILGSTRVLLVSCISVWTATEPAGSIQRHTWAAEAAEPLSCPSAGKQQCPCLNSPPLNPTAGKPRYLHPRVGWNLKSLTLKTRVLASVSPISSHTWKHNLTGSTLIHPP